MFGQITSKQNSIIFFVHFFLFCLPLKKPVKQTTPQVQLPSLNLITTSALLIFNGIFIRYLPWRAILGSFLSNVSWHLKQNVPNMFGDLSRGKRFMKRRMCLSALMATSSLGSSSGLHWWQAVLHPSPNTYTDTQIESHCCHGNSAGGKKHHWQVNMWVKSVLLLPQFLSSFCVSGLRFLAFLGCVL